MAKNISVSETLVAGARERRMVRDGIFDAEFSEPAIGEVHLYFTTDQTLQADRKDIPTTSIRIISSGSTEG